MLAPVVVRMLASSATLRIIRLAVVVATCAAALHVLVVAQLRTLLAAVRERG